MGCSLSTNTTFLLGHLFCPASFLSQTIAISTHCLVYFNKHIWFLHFPQHKFCIKGQYYKKAQRWREGLLLKPQHICGFEEESAIYQNQHPFRWKPKTAAPSLWLSMWLLCLSLSLALGWEDIFNHPPGKNAHSFPNNDGHRCLC